VMKKMLETLEIYKIIIAVAFISFIIYAMLNDPIKKNRLH